MIGKLNGKRIAIVVADGFEEVEMTEPRQALEDAGAITYLISPAEGKVRGWKMTEWGDSFSVDVPMKSASADDYDALLLPGGVMNPDKLRIDKHAIAFVRAFFEEHKPVAAICHGPWTLIDADAVRGRTMTSYPSIKTDLKNAGALWVDREVVVDQGLVDQPQARRYTRVQSEDDRGICRRRPRRSTTGSRITSASFHKAQKDPRPGTAGIFLAGENSAKKGFVICAEISFGRQ